MLDSNWPKLTSPNKEGTHILTEISPHGESRPHPLPSSGGITQARDIGDDRAMRRCQDEAKDILKKSPINSISKFKCYTHTHQNIADCDVIIDGDCEPEEDSKRDFGSFVQPTDDDKSTLPLQSLKKEVPKSQVKPNKGFSIDAILERPHSISSEETRDVKIDDDDEDVDILPEVRDEENEDDDEDGAENDFTEDVSMTTESGRIFENFPPENLKHPLDCQPLKPHSLPFLSGSRNAAIFSAAMLYRFLAKSKQNCQDFGHFHKSFQSFPYLNLPHHSHPISNRFENPCFGRRSGFWSKSLSGLDESMERLYKPRPHHLKSYKDGVTQQPSLVQVEGQGWRSEVGGKRRVLGGSRESSPSKRRTGSGIEEDDDGFVVVDCGGGDDTETIVSHERSKGGHGGEVSHHQSGQTEQQVKEKKKHAHSTGSDSSNPLPWPAWVYCTRYSDRPSSGY